MAAKHPDAHYGSYLQLEKVLDAQNLRSATPGPAAHDEMLFIVIHQVYELWFKQILHELGSLVPLFEQERMGEERMGFVVARLERVVEIQRILVSQLDILETMTPLDFLDFRDYLVPASGFQSVQFRLLESLLGLRREDRAAYSQDAYRTRLTKDEQKEVEKSEGSANLMDLVESWLERFPFLDQKGYNFWEHYQGAVATMLDADAKIIADNPTLSEEAKSDQLEQLEETHEGFRALANKDSHEKLCADGARRLSHRAMSAALFIELYRDYPALQLPHKLLKHLVDVDELFATWRHRHAIMVHRMIGRKIGTGGSSGHRYLGAAAQKHRVFTDLFDLPTYLIPRSALPTLPPQIEKRLRFTYEGEL